MSGRRRRTRSEEGESPLLTSRSSSPSAYVPYVVTAMEAVLLALVCLSPWSYGTVHPGFEFLLNAGIALLLLLWAARMLLEWQITWKKSGVALCLAGLFLISVWQCKPLSRSVLSWMSPGAVRCYEELLPQQPEELPGQLTISNGMTPPGSTISLYPGATRRESAHLLAVFLVFLVVYNNLTSKQTLIRLSWAAVLNGVLLSIFAIAQFFAAPPSMVYWTYPSFATPFGPFICHNHFPDYVNICIGLGIGLLVSQGRRGRSSDFSREDSSLFQVLQTPRTLWICAALGLMVSAVAFSRSRGGMLALVGASLVCGILGWLRLGRSFRIGTILLVVGVVLALSSWFGIGLLKNRLATLWSGEAYESRIPLWLRSLPIPADFPIWGTGFGTYGYIEPKYRKDEPTQERLASFDHTHSDYFEVLIEGGVISFVVVIIALVIVYRRSYRALLLHSGHTEAGLALGALFGFTALALHCFGEFGAHIPAIALFGTVICAHLCALGIPKTHRSRHSSRRRSSSWKEQHVESISSAASQEEIPVDNIETEKEEDYLFRLGGVAPAVGVIVALGLGLVLCSGAWKVYRIDRLQDAAFRAGDEDADQLENRIACLTEAVSLDPEDAQLHYELGSAHGRLAELLGFATEARRSVLEETTAALQEHLRARDACPLLSGAHLGIATYASRLERGDTAEDYIRRTKLLTPGQDAMCYWCGLRELALNHPEEAWSTWQHCLELSSRYLPEILNLTKRIQTNLLVEKVLPDNPEVILAAALQLYPEPVYIERRRPVLKKAIRLLEAKADGMEPKDILVKARIYKALDETQEANQCYRELLEKTPSDVQSRFEFARYLYEQRKLEEARRELRLVVAQEPKNDWARGALDNVMREIIRGEDAPKRVRPRSGWFRR